MPVYRRTKGVGMIEVLIALGVFSFAYLALLSYQTKLQREYHHIQERQAALDLARSQLTELRTLLTPTDFDKLTSGSRIDPSAKYHLSWNVTSDSHYAKQVTVQVFWQGTGGAQQLHLSTLIARTTAIDVARIEF